VSADGWVRITGRKRERILRGGYSVFPPEVESVLLGHPDVAEAAVLGVPHPELGEEVAAFVALRPGARATADELVEYCRDHLAAFKYPRRVRLLPALPRGATGKVLKGELRRQALSAGAPLTER
jgi:long-chain acyl-CoA synthetase